LNTSSKVVSISQIEDFKDKIDVMILCRGSAKDLPEQVVMISKFFNTVDSLDTHAKIPTYFKEVDEASKTNHKLSLISTGWDPGLFSMARLLSQSILPQGERLYLLG
jgi:diaminopimelate dehydrogenase